MIKRAKQVRYGEKISSQYTVDNNYNIKNSYSKMNIKKVNKKKKTY